MNLNLNEIREIVENYNRLYELAKAKIAIMGPLDSTYNTARGITDISFEESVVSVTCDDSSRGCYDELWFEFPIEWLSKDDEELKRVVETERDRRREEERLQKELKDNQAKLAAEEREKQEYQRLKAKFDDFEKTQIFFPEGLSRE